MTSNLSHTLSLSFFFLFPHLIWFNLIEYRKKLIKTAREKLNDSLSSCYVSPTLSYEQTIARESVFKAVLNSNKYISTQQQQQQQTAAVNTQEQKSTVSQQLLKSIYSEMNYNDLKKQKIKKQKQQIWSQFLDACVREANDPQAHVADLCKKHKIALDWSQKRIKEPQTRK